MGDRLIVWNGTNQLIVKDGEWTYDIKPNEENPWGNAAIGRTNANGEKEFGASGFVGGFPIEQNERDRQKDR